MMCVFLCFCQNNKHKKKTKNKKQKTKKNTTGRRRRQKKVVVNHDFRKFFVYFILFFVCLCLCLLQEIILNIFELCNNEKCDMICCWYYWKSNQNARNMGTTLIWIFFEIFLNPFRIQKKFSLEIPIVFCLKICLMFILILIYIDLIIF